MDASRWLPCEDGWVKLSVCGSCRGTQGAVGGVIRDSEGLFILGYAKDVDTSSPLMAEFVALHEGLRLVRTRKFTNVAVETQFIDGDKLLNNEYSSTIGFTNIIHSCREMIEEEEMTTEFTKVPAVSRAAAFICYRGFLVEQLQVFEEIPSDNIRNALLLDLMGKKNITYPPSNST